MLPADRLRRRMNYVDMLLQHRLIEAIQLVEDLKRAVKFTVDGRQRTDLEIEQLISEGQENRRRMDQEALTYL